MLGRSMKNCYVVLLVVVLCLHGQQAQAQPRGSRIRGEEHKFDNGGRRLFADKLTRPNDPVRGGAAGAAKGLTEQVAMRTPVTAAPAPTAVTGPPTLAPVPATAAPVDPNRNDRCAQAKGPIEVTPQGLGNSRAIVYDDTTAGARVPEVVPDRCNSITTSAPGVWYKVVGTGELMVRSGRLSFTQPLINDAWFIAHFFVFIFRRHLFVGEAQTLIPRSLSTVAIVVVS